MTQETNVENRRAFQRAERTLLAEIDPGFAVTLAAEQACRSCGCSDSLACEDGCYWVEADLCSRCGEEQAA